MNFTTEQRENNNKNTAKIRETSGIVLRQFLKRGLDKSQEIKVSPRDEKKPYALFAGQVNNLLKKVKNIAEKSQNEPLSKEEQETLEKCFRGSGCEVAGIRREYDKLIKADSGLFKKSEFQEANEILSKMEAMRSIYLINRETIACSEKTLECHQVRSNILEHFEKFDRYVRGWRSIREGFDFSNIDSEVKGQEDTAKMAEKIYQDSYAEWLRRVGEVTANQQLVGERMKLTYSLADLHIDRQDLWSIKKDLNQVRESLTTLDQAMKDHKVQTSLAEERYKEQEQQLSQYILHKQGLEGPVHQAEQEQQNIYKEYPKAAKAIREVVAINERIDAITKEEKLLGDKEVNTFVKMLLTGYKGGKKFADINAHVENEIKRHTKVKNSDQFNQKLNRAAELIQFYAQEKRMSVEDILKTIRTLDAAAYLKKLSSEKKTLEENRNQLVNKWAGYLGPMETDMKELAAQIRNHKDNAAIIRKEITVIEQLIKETKEQRDAYLKQFEQMKGSMTDKGEAEVIRKGLSRLTFAGQCRIMKDVVDQAFLEKYKTGIPGLNLVAENGEHRCDLKVYEACLADMRVMVESLDKAYPDKKKMTDASIAAGEKEVEEKTAELEQSVKRTKDELMAQPMVAKLQSDYQYNLIGKIKNLKAEQNSMLETHKDLRADVEECNRWRKDFEDQLESRFTGEVLASLHEKYKTLNDARKTYHHVNSDEYNNMIQPLCKILGFKEVPGNGDDLKNAVMNPEVKATRGELKNALQQMKQAARVYIQAKEQQRFTWGTAQRVQRLSFANQLIRFADDMMPQFDYIERFKVANKKIMDDYVDAADKFRLLDSSVKSSLDKPEEETYQFGRMLNKMARLSYKCTFAPDKVVAEPQTAVPTI